MKSFIDKSGVPHTYKELKELSIADLIKIRFFTLKGSNTKKEKEALELIDDLLEERELEFTLDDLSHIMEVRSFKDSMSGQKQRIRHMGETLIRVYNSVLCRLVPIDHPFRYRYIMKDYLNNENAKTETMAWLIGNSHFGPGWRQKADTIREIIEEADIHELNILAKRFVDGKASESRFLLTRKDELDPKLLKKIMSFRFISVHDYQSSIPQNESVVINKEFIEGIATSKVIGVLGDLARQYKNNHSNVSSFHRKIELEISKNEMKKLLFSYISNTNVKSDDITYILDSFYGSTKCVM